ncbi:MBL fold metallo-hydrolase (plasmid) [Rhodococcus pyridinivorans]|uniref:MBL fold metallo-hydrolase n=1 Tax=Rhodococcus pyridinivorans TaxID=103816 RepID=UPI001C2F40B8|nr:MBL fold metallo-hydrolase [Rhodococcus pyridinivorans]QXF84279.1 MBL fold metallo-hydrolase [Rhodococcus pyridinivorans]
MFITKLNNAGLVVSTAGTSIAVDIGKDVPAVDVAALAVDAVFISHIHADHFDLINLETLARPVHGPREVVQALAGSTVPVQKIEPGDHVRIGEIDVIARTVDHGPISAPIVNLGFEISTSDHRVWFAGDIARDTEPLPDEPVDMILIPVGGGKVFDPAAAVTYARRFKGATVVPIHFDYSMAALLEFCERAQLAGLDIVPAGIREQVAVTSGKATL